MLLSKDKDEKRTLERQANLILKNDYRRIRKARKKFAVNLNNKRFPSEEWFRALLLKHSLKIDRNRGQKSHKYFRWQPNYVEGNYIIDFAWSKAKIGVEIDGRSHVDKARADQLRDEFLKSRGWAILRVPVDDMTRALEVIQLLKQIKEVCRFSLHIKVKGTKKSNPIYARGHEVVEIARNPEVLAKIVQLCLPDKPNFMK